MLGVSRGSENQKLRIQWYRLWETLPIFWLSKPRGWCQEASTVREAAHDLCLHFAGWNSGTWLHQTKGSLENIPSFCSRDSRKGFSHHHTAFTLFAYHQGLFGLVWFLVCCCCLFYPTYVSHISCLVFSKSTNIWLNILRQLQKKF